MGCKEDAKMQRSRGCREDASGLLFMDATWLQNGCPQHEICKWAHPCIFAAAMHPRWHPTCILASQPTSLHPSPHPCIPARILASRPTPLHPSLHPCIQARTLASQPASLHPSPHPCIPACILAPQSTSEPTFLHLIHACRLDLCTQVASQPADVCVPLLHPAVLIFRRILVCAFTGLGRAPYQSWWHVFSMWGKRVHAFSTCYKHGLYMLRIRIQIVHYGM